MKKIIASQRLKDLVNSYEHESRFAEFVGLHPATVFRILRGANVNSGSIVSILSCTGFKFEEAFQIIVSQRRKNDKVKVSS